MKLTSEQEGVVASQAASVVVNAFAGTGKTSTLVEYARARPEQKILYIAFNKAVAEEAKARFPSNVESRTSHSMAYGGAGWKYKDKLGNPKAWHVKNFLKIDHLDANHALLLSTIALERVMAFCASGAAEIDIDPMGVKMPRAVPFDASDILTASLRIWHAMCDTKNLDMPMPHDGYLKLWQLSNPDLSKYDTVLLDEAQDTNPCLFEIFRGAEGSKVLVGDTHQNIYAFRGAMNAMRRMKGEQHALTSSFRFGQDVADVANGVLDIFKNEKLRLQGLGGTSHVGDPVKGLRTAHLHRTNAGLFDQSVELLKRNQPLAFVGRFRNYNPDQIMDAYRLMEGENRAIRDPFIRMFSKFNEMQEYAETVGDKELSARIRVVEKYGDRIPSLIEKLEAVDACTPEATAMTLLTTAHKSKGLEWPQVVLGEDFPHMMEKGAPLHADYMSPDSESDPLGDEEANLIYVAATRARECLVPFEHLDAFADWHAQTQAKSAKKSFEMSM